MKYSIIIIILTFPLIVFSQEDIKQEKDIKLGERYWEDQLYISITYNTLNSQPEKVPESGFSYGLALGYIKDIPFNKAGKWAAGIGLGYAYDSFNHEIHVLAPSNQIVLSQSTEDKVRLHSLEIPIQFRWRNSDSVTYSFWRIYGGARLGYNFNNLFISNQGDVRNLSSYNNFQAGLELSIGYSALNFYMYYGLSPMYKDTVINNEILNTKMAKFGLIFYLL